METRKVKLVVEEPGLWKAAGHTEWIAKLIDINKIQVKEVCLVDLTALLAEKKKKATENQKSFPKNMKATSGNNNQRQMPMRKSGRGK